MGGASGINLLLGMVRVKFAALLIGTVGVGLNASFVAMQSLISTVAGLGLQSSAVREIAAASANDDQAALSRTVLTLRRICWLTGLIGMTTMMLLSPLLSQLTFGNREHTLDIAALGFVILLANVSGGQMALIQGMRRIGDMARANIIGALLGTGAAVGFYAALGLRGIVPTLVTVAAIQLVISWYYAHKVPIAPIQLSLKQMFVEANSMVRLGLVMMTSSLMSNAVAYFTIALVSHHGGVQAVGIYSAAFALSGMFVNFILNAMGADYFPRLTRVAADKAVMNHLVNEQTEIGILLALPGLLATLALAPWIVQIFYTHEFLDAVELLQWFILGCMGRVISWPLGFVMLALGKGRWYLFTETTFNGVHLLLIALGLALFGLAGVAIAFFVMCLGYILIVYLVCRHLTDFAWSATCQRIALLTLPILAVTFFTCRSLAIWPASVVGMTLTLFVSVLCLRELAARVGPEHRVVKVAARFPVTKLLFIRSP